MDYIKARSSLGRAYVSLIGNTFGRFKASMNKLARVGFVPENLSSKQALKSV